MHSGNVYPGSVSVWQQVSHEWARKRIVERIRQVDPKIQKPVHEGIRVRYPEVGLPEHGIVFSHCYRMPASRTTVRRSLEDNITVLINMGIANRSRALHVLEAEGNDLDTAVNILLASRK
jgi:hypothetical protein